MTKIVVDTYTFTAASKTVDIPNVSGLQLDGIQLITNLVDNVIIYQFNDSARGGTLSGTTLTLDYDTTSMSDTDQLMIIYDIPTDSANVDVNITNSSSLPMSGLSAAVPVGVVDGSGNQTGITGNPIIVDAGSVALPVSGATVAIPTAIVDGSGNQITSFGGGTEYSVGSAAPTDPTGKAIVFENSSGNWENVGEGGGFGQPLPVDIKTSTTIDVNIVGGSSSGTQYAEGDALGSTPTGTLMIGRKFSDDTAEGVTVGTANTKRPIHVHTIDANGDVRPNATLYQSSDTANSADLAPGVAWKESEGSGNWNITGLHAPLPVQQINDKQATGTITGGGQQIDLNDLSGVSSVTAYVTGSFTLTMVLKVSYDGGINYVTLGALGAAAPLYDPNTGSFFYEINTAGIYQANIAGATDVRLDCVAYTSGSATVKVSVSSGIGVVPEQRSMRQSANYGRLTATTSAASYLLQYNSRRSSILIKNIDTVTIYLGFSNSLTTSNGLPLSPGETWSSSDYSGQIYAVVASSTAQLAYTEVY